MSSMVAPVQVTLSTGGEQPTRTVPLGGFRQRVSQIRWIGMFWLPGSQDTDDEMCAVCVCCPCYMAGITLGMIALPFVMIGYVASGFCGVFWRVCTGTGIRSPDVQNAASLGVDAV